MTARPTQEGDQLAQQLLKGRSTPLVETVAKLDETDQQALSELLEKVLTQVYDEVGQGQRICRLCDRESCTRSAPCPVGQAERGEQI